MEWPKNLTDEQIFNRIVEINKELEALRKDRLSLYAEQDSRLEEKAKAVIVGNARKNG